MTHDAALPDTPTPRPTRRRALQTLGAGGAVIALGGLGAGAHRLLGAHLPGNATISLYSSTVAVDGNGRRSLLAPPSDPGETSDSTSGTGTASGSASAGSAASSPRLDPGTRLLAGTPADSPAARRADEFLAGAATWLADVPDAFADLARSAVWDLWTLSDGLPAPVAGWSTSWRYIWPRDTAFCAVALARIGHADTALDHLAHLQGLQSADGWFEARYSPTTGEAPDERPRQFDGTGLALWAAAEVIGTQSGSARTKARRRLAPLLTTSRDALLRATDHGTQLPPVSPDYWEVSERAVTLGIMASTLAGLEAAGRLDAAGSGVAAGAEESGTGTDDEERAEGAEAFRRVLVTSFGPHGFQRRARSGGADSALAFLDATGSHGIVGADQLRALRRTLARPAGGIAPGARWRRDGVSWTPSTSLLALGLARAGDADGARDLLGWLDRHRTADGSLPEKVLADGSPAAVAPLAWTAANVLLTLDAIRRG
ncbi:hypothetical protein I8D64_10145 [Brachybacterium sp. MASK1Z-5]|uniref:Glycoside hydrolase family 15 n=1 Tax=Brachybacterium halotolerans TaxID=2795215 RepID=A0ABS1BCN9_9MICO|nr:hypothetical protein [Brachybacterium halotolerans]MBK0331765.1 hypothetical protein [Brachybacterium halotolerans]